MFLPVLEDAVQGMGLHRNPGEAPFRLVRESLEEPGQLPSEPGEYRDVLYVQNFVLLVREAAGLEAVTEYLDSQPVPVEEAEAEVGALGGYLSQVALVAVGAIA